MSGNDSTAACDRLIQILERAQHLGKETQPESKDVIASPIVPFTVALLRMRVRPALTLGWLETDPVHLVLVGGTNTGKSTVLNLLLGRDAAAMGVRARFSQHPEAYCSSPPGDLWLDRFDSRFHGYRRYRNEHPPRQTDEELRAGGYIRAFSVIDPLSVNSPELAPLFSTSAVVWDGPDFSTEAAESYLSTVVDLMGMADLVVMTVTDEAYADDRGNAFLRLLADAGIAVQAVANKVPSNPSLLNDMARTLETIGRTQTPLLHLPDTRGASPTERLQRLLQTPEAGTVRESLAHAIQRGGALKKRALGNSIQFIGRHLDGVLNPLLEEAGAAAAWSQIVDRVTHDRIHEPYRRDYLEGMHYEEFNRTIMHLVELLRIPFVGPLVEVAGQLVRIPVRLIGLGIRKLMKLPAANAHRISEEEVLRGVVDPWLLALASEAQAQAVKQSHPSWNSIVARLDDPGFRAGVRDRFERDCATYRLKFDDEVKRRAESLYLKLKEDPRRLHALRGANLLAGTASVVLAVKTAGIGWSDAVVGPVVAGVWHNLLEWGLGRYVDTLRTDLVNDQLLAVDQTVGTSLAEPLKGLFHVAVTEGDLASVRADFALVEREATRIAGGSDA